MAAVTELELIYRLTSLVRDHLRSHEDADDPSLLPSDTAGGILTDIEHAVECRQAEDAQR